MVLWQRSRSRLIALSSLTWLPHITDHPDDGDEERKKKVFKRNILNVWRSIKDHKCVLLTPPLSSALYTHSFLP